MEALEPARVAAGLGKIGSQPGRGQETERGHDQRPTRV
jgi:hypothetical protein